jgi:DNA polymerase III subunit epsilon
MPNNLPLDRLASLLEQSGEYRVLRRLTPRGTRDDTEDAVAGRGVFVGLETTGRDPGMHELIEIALVPFTYSAEGRILNVGEPYHSFQMPFMPLSPEVSKRTGITTRMVDGCLIDVGEVERMVADADWICSQDSQHDRPFAEQVTPAFAKVRWACTLTQVPWREAGYGGAKLGRLLAELGYFASLHRAHEDCVAAVEILSQCLPNSEATAFAKLVVAAEAPTYQVWAVQCPLGRIRSLRARGYRWNEIAKPGRPKAWYRELSEEMVGLELQYLRREIYEADVDVPVTEVTAFDRFSHRI